MKSFTISARSSLAEARRLQDLDTVTVDTQRLKARNLLPLALKTALWAVRPGGEIVIQDASPPSPGPDPYQVIQGMIRQWTFKFIGADCDLVALEPQRIVLKRKAEVIGPGWSAGVIFSGNDGEIPLLRANLQGLLRQPELDAGQGGEIVVCGPERDLSFLSDYPSVRYLTFETAPGPRFMVCEKKNFLMRALKNPRMVIMHVRVVLEEGALAAVPREFEIASPDVAIETRRGRAPYLSLIQSDTMQLGAMPRRVRSLLRDAPGCDPLRLMERGPVFVDGGVFFVTKRVFDACPLHDEIAWNEAEDVEWCARAFAQGFVSELVPGSDALSQTTKLKDYSGLGPAEVPLRTAKRWVQTIRGRLRHHLARLRGEC